MQSGFDSSAHVVRWWGGWASRSKGQWPARQEPTLGRTSDPSCIDVRLLTGLLDGLHDLLHGVRHGLRVVGVVLFLCFAGVRGHGVNGPSVSPAHGSGRCARRTGLAEPISQLSPELGPRTRAKAPASLCSARPLPFGRQTASAQSNPDKAKKTRPKPGPANRRQVRQAISALEWQTSRPRNSGCDAWHKGAACSGMGCWGRSCCSQTPPLGSRARRRLGTRGPHASAGSSAASTPLPVWL